MSRAKSPRGHIEGAPLCQVLKQPRGYKQGEPLRQALYRYVSTRKRRCYVKSLGHHLSTSSGIVMSRAKPPLEHT